MAALAGMLAARGGGRAPAAELPAVRIGILQFGTAQWLADVIRHHGLDAAHGIALVPVKLANTDAGRIALLAKAADIVVSDWFFVAAQRGAGTRLSFAPFSGAAGAIMVPARSPVATLADLKDRHLGVAGGPLDKSWLLVQAAARRTAGLDLAASEVSYGAPPLLSAKLQQGELDAVLTYWNFAARLEAEGFRQLVSVSECVRALGLPDRLDLIGFVFHEDWARAHPQTIGGFLNAAAAAERLLARDEAEWRRIRPLMDASDDALYQALKRRFLEGLAHPAPEAQAEAAARLFDIVRQTGGTRATSGLERLPDGTFWRTGG